MGANLTDNSFSVLGGRVDFSAVCELSSDLEIAELQRALEMLDAFAGAETRVRPYNFKALHGLEGDVTQRITASGGDQPGLVVRLCATFVEFGANIVTLNAEPLAEKQDLYVSLPEAAAHACISTVTNTAEAFGLSCTIDRF